MASPPASPAGRVIRFGVFEADLAAGELRKSGARIRLQEQPFQLLAFLLERAGTIVSREELRQKLWPADTFVDFDHSLNTAVAKLREALGDSASSPRFIETLARRGYRFVAPVESHAAPVSRGNGAVTAVNASAQVSVHPELEIPMPHRSLTRSLFALIQIMYLSFYVVALFQLQGVERLADKYLAGRSSFIFIAAVIATSGVGIVLRCYMLSAIAFDYRKLRHNFERLFPAILLLDELWAVAPFLIAEKIGFGASFAATAALLYVPFSQRTLLRLAYPGPSH